MPLYPNGSSSQKILTFTGMGTYVRENYSLCHERVTVSLNYVATPAWHLNLNLFSKGKGRSRGAQSKYDQRRLPELVWKSVWLEIVITVV